MTDQHHAFELTILRPHSETKYTGRLVDGTVIRAERLGPWTTLFETEAPTRCLPEFSVSDDLKVTIGDRAPVTIAIDEPADERPLWYHQSAGIMLTRSDLPEVPSGGRWNERPLFCAVLRGPGDEVTYDEAFRTIWWAESDHDNAISSAIADLASDLSPPEHIVECAALRRLRCEAIARYYTGEIERSQRYAVRALKLVTAA